MSLTMAPRWSYKWSIAGLSTAVAAAVAVASRQSATIFRPYPVSRIRFCGRECGGPV